MYMNSLIFHREDLSTFFGGVFNGGIASRYNQNLLPGQTNQDIKDLIINFQSLASAGSNTKDKLKDMIDEAQRLGGSSLSTYFSDLAREGKYAEASLQGVYEVMFEDTKGISNVSNIIATFNGLSDGTGQLSKEQKELAGAVAKTNGSLGNFLTNSKGAKVSAIQYATSLVGAKLKTVALTAATAALDAAISLGISVAIQGLITLIGNAINAFDNAIDKVENAKVQISESQKNIERLNSELSDTKRRLNELSTIQTPTLFEQDEINRLKEYNAQLERQIALEERKKKIAQQVAREESLKAWNTIAGGWTTLSSGQNLAFTANYLQNKTVSQNQAALERYGQLLSHINQEEQRYLKEGIEETETSRLAAMRKEAESLQSQLMEFSSALEIIRDGLDPENLNDKTIIDVIDIFLEKYYDLNQLSEQSTFTDVWNSADYTDITNDLKRLAAQGKLTEETFSHVAGINKFTEALAKIEITDVSEIIRAIIEEITKSGNEAELAQFKLSKYSEQLEKIKSSLDSKSSLRTSIQSAFNTIMNGESLTDDDIQKFMDYPELFSKITKTTNGWSISVDELSKSYGRLSSEARDAINTAKSEVLSDRDAKILQYQNNQRFSHINSPDDYNKYVSAQADLQSQIDESNTALSSFNVLLELYSGSLEQSDKATINLTDDIKALTSNLSVGANAQKEMNKNGKVSIDTFLSLTALGEDYIKCISIQGNEIRFNADAFKKLEKAKIDDEIATTKLTEAEIIYNRNQAAMYGDTALANELNVLLRDTQLKKQTLEAYRDSYDDTWASSFTETTDQAKEDFDNFMNDWQLQYDRGLITGETYYSKLSDANKQFYKDCEEHAEDYQSNLTKIWEHEKDEWDKKAEAEKDALAEQLRLGYIDQEAYDAGIVNIAERYYGSQAVIHSSAIGAVNASDTEWGRDKYKALTDEASNNDQDQYKEDFQKELDNINDQLEKGFLKVAEWRQRYADLRDNWWGESSDWYGTSFASDMYDEMSEKLENVDDLYNERLTNLQKSNDKSIEAEQRYISDWKNLNEQLYKDADNKKYESNRKEIAEYELDVLGRTYSEGYITAKEYFDKVTALWNENSDILGKDTQYEWLEDAWKKRADDEKLYWEQQKELATQYYNAEIEKLRDVQNEEERLNKAEELRLNLIKARQALEDAKNNKTQLEFHDGIFEYVADQDAVMSAEEEVANALKEIRTNELQEQIAVLEDQRDEALLFYDNIIGMLDYYINGTRQIESSDPEVLARAEASNAGTYFMRLMRGEVTMDDIREELKAKYSKSNTSTEEPKSSTNTTSQNKPNTKTAADKTESATASGTTLATDTTERNAEEKAEGKYGEYLSAWKDSLLGKSIVEIKDIVKGLWSQVKGNNQIGLEDSYAQDTAASAISNVYNNSNISDDHSVNVGDIHMTIQGGTSQEMLDQFANKLSSAISSIVPKAVTQ